MATGNGPPAAGWMAIAGMAECPVTFRAQPGEVVQLVGAKPVGGWSKPQGQILTTSLADQGFTP
jgi:hypothetical protein